jgi:hypothetical protein
MKISCCCGITGGNCTQVMITKHAPIVHAHRMFRWREQFSTAQFCMCKMCLMSECDGNYELTAEDKFKQGSSRKCPELWAEILSLPTLTFTMHSGPKRDLETYRLCCRSKRL